MKKYLKILFITLLFIPLLSVKAVNSSKVKYEVNKYYVNSEIEIAGGVHVRQLIEVEGTYNGYYQNFTTKNTNLVAFTGLESDLLGSSIYNPSGIENIQVGKIINTDNLTLNSLTTENLEGNIEYFEEVEVPKNGDKGVYSVDKDSDGNVSIKMYNETTKGKTVFYLEYVITNVLVEHNDSAEFYYTFINQKYADKIKDLKIFVSLPYPTEKVFKIWAHGQRDATVFPYEDWAVVAEIANYQVGSGIDIRILFDKELFQININESKKSKLDAIPLVEKVEKQRAAEANKYRKRDQIVHYGMYGLHGIYILFLAGLTAFIYFKYDREYKSSFNGEYYREIIDDYPVETLEYLLNKDVTANSFSASILNLIYKKNIVSEKINDSKDDYLLIKKSDKGISDNESKIMELLFNKIGNGEEVKLSDIKKEANNVSLDGKNYIYDSFEEWKNSVISSSEKQKFFIDNNKVKVVFFCVGFIGILLYILDKYLIHTYLSYVTLGISIVFMLYILLFRKRTVKGNDDYNKWMGFKNFLNDFGRFDEKELPEIALWEKYLIYAHSFGIADKVSKTMEVKFKEINPDTNIDSKTFTNYYLFSSMSNNLSKSINSSVTKAYSSVQHYKSNNWSDGSGGGGGFSAGGGFGGGGGATGGGF